MQASRHIVICVMCAVCAMSTVLFADCIPYCNIGTVATAHSYYAEADGWIVATFQGSDADFEDVALLYDWTTFTLSDAFFPNHITNKGDMQNVLQVTAGDMISVLIYDFNTGRIYDSEDLGKNADGLNHAYGANSDQGLYFGLEDLASFEQADLDYNDMEFYLTNLTMSDWVPPNQAVATPEPNTVFLLGTALLVLRARRLHL